MIHHPSNILFWVPHEIFETTPEFLNLLSSDKMSIKPKKNHRGYLEGMRAKIASQERDASMLIVASAFRRSAFR